MSRDHLGREGDTHNAHRRLPARAPGHVCRVQGWPGGTLIPVGGVVIVKQSPVGDVLYCFFMRKLEQKRKAWGWKEPEMVQLFPWQQQGKLTKAIMLSSSSDPD